MSASLAFQSRRSDVYSRKGIVATSQPLAVVAGLRALEAGGNAADAAVATAAALNLTEPTSTGLGGDCFALFYDASTREVTAMNGSGRAPAALSLERLQRENLGDALPPFHAYTVTVPGAAAGWCDLVARHGRLSMAQVLAPIIRMAAEGVPISPLTAYYWQRGVEKQLSQAYNGTELTINGRAPRAGEIWRNFGLAKTMQLIAEGGKTAFYQGALAESIVAALNAAGGCMTPDDLAAHTTTWEDPIAIDYHGVRIWECPPNGQGLAALLALNLLEEFDLAALPPLSPQRLHLEMEAMRLAFADAFQFIADPVFAPAPLEALLSKAYARERRALINPAQINPAIQHGRPQHSSGTVYLSVVDGAGNACSFINSNYMGFGTGIVPRGFGFSLQNRGHNFSLTAGHPNALAPGKRPYHTIIPAMATTATGDLYASFGVMGGFMQPQGHMQVTVAMVNDGASPQAALDRPRFCLDSSIIGPDVLLEEGISQRTARALEEMGHKVKLVRGLERTAFGRGQIIRRNPQTGMLCGGSDLRADGCAMSLE